MADAITGWRKLLRDLAVDFIDSGAAAEVLKLVEQSLKGTDDDGAPGAFEPEDTTPRVGDTVRVREGAVGTDTHIHRHCVGDRGTLERRDDGWYKIGGHYGPLSDFELVERAEAQR